MAARHGGDGLGPDADSFDLDRGQYLIPLWSLTVLHQEVESSVAISTAMDEDQLHLD